MDRTAAMCALKTVLSPFTEGIHNRQVRSELAEPISCPLAVNSISLMASLLSFRNKVYYDKALLFESFPCDREICKRG